MHSLTREICAALALTLLGAWHGGGRVGAQQFEELSPEVRGFVAVEARHVVIHDVRLIDGRGARLENGCRWCYGTDESSAWGPRAKWVTSPVLSSSMAQATR